MQTETKESKWDMPEELLLLLENVEKEGSAANALVYVHPHLEDSHTPIDMRVNTALRVQERLVSHKVQLQL